MNETTSSPIDLETGGPADRGLRSAPGIRWLLLAGSMVTGVSVYRLVQARWAAIPVPLQFLVLIAGALAIFALGTITRRRLRLPTAGSALLALFAGLVPVMAWGAVYLRLLDTPGGWLAFSAGAAALLGAAVNVLRAELRYPERLYPAVLGGLLAAQAVLPWLGERLPGFEAAVYALAALGLGALLWAGSRHVNRFFFHRDRRDGMDRPVHLVPFLLLGVLYLGALALLDLRSTFMALPLAVLGIVLAGTGEEYYRALAASLGHAPERWPGRSVALLATGFSCVTIALPLALLDPALRYLPLVAACAAFVFLRWSLRYDHPAAHVAGVAAAFIAYHSSPALFPELARTAKEALTFFLGLGDGSPALVGWGDLGFLALLTVLGVALARRQAPERLRRLHGILIAVQVLAITALSLGEATLSTVVLLAGVLGLVLLGLPACRRIEPAMVAPFTLAALGFVGIKALFGLDPVSSLIATLAFTGVELGGLALAARRAPGRWLARCCGSEPKALEITVTLSLRNLIRGWLALATAACLLFAGLDALLLSLIVIAVLFLTRTELEGWARRIAVPARLSLLPVLQLAALGAGDGLQRDLPLAVLSLGIELLPWIAGLGLVWSCLLEPLGRRRSLGPWTLGLQLVTGVGYLAAFVLHTPLSPWANGALIVAASGWMTLAVRDGLREPFPEYGWTAQIWVGLAVLHGFTAGWLHLGSGLAPYVLLGAGAAEYVLGAWLDREGLGEAFSSSCRRLGLALPLAAGVLSLVRTPAGSVWFPALAAFLVSLFYTLMATREPRRIFPSVASAAFLGLGLLKVIATTQLGLEFYFLAPGLALLALAWLLRAELGPAWSRHLTAAGASCVYATPIVALSGAISWGWLAALLVLTVAFGAASFALRSRSLLTVSTAAMLTDLGFFVFRIGTTAPTVLWVLGLGFGLALMAVAAWLEYQREGLLQQIRLFGRELSAWS